MKKGRKTLAGMFLKYICLFSVNTLLLLAAVLLLFNYWLAMGIVLPANFGERTIQENLSAIVNNGTVTEDLLPEGSFYGIYSEEGEWQYGSFDEKEQKSAWEHYRRNQTSVNYGGRQYYGFYERKNGEIAIVRISMVAQFAKPAEKGVMVNAENLLIGGFVALFLLQTFFVAKIFAKRLRKELELLQQVTEAIEENNLEFAEAHSEVKEIEQVFVSLNRMRDALKNSLEQQWETEQKKRQQLSALAHDIKTPLAVIRGNAELLEEGSLPEEEAECNRYILKSAGELEQYFTTMKQLLSSGEKQGKREMLSVEQMKHLFLGQAEQLRRIYPMEIVVGEKKNLQEDKTAENLQEDKAAESLQEDKATEDLQEDKTAESLQEEKAAESLQEEKIAENLWKEKQKGFLRVDKSQILRAWNNLLENAMEYTDRECGIRISFEMREQDLKKYWIARVEDYGRGFSEAELRHGTEEFYRGDDSRSGREHQGLGLAIAEKFVTAEGGFLRLKNSSETGGAAVELWIPIYAAGAN